MTWAEQIQVIHRLSGVRNFQFATSDINISVVISPIGNTLTSQSGEPAFTTRNGQDLTDYLNSFHDLELTEAW